MLFYMPCEDALAPVHLGAQRLRRRHVRDHALFAQQEAAVRLIDADHVGGEPIPGKARAQCRRVEQLVRQVMPLAGEQ